MKKRIWRDLSTFELQNLNGGEDKRVDNWLLWFTNKIFN